MKIYENEIEKVNQIREQWRQNDEKRDIGIKEEDVKSVLDIPYVILDKKEEETCHLMDIYYPKEWNQATYPVIVSVHGGGWFYGDKELYRLYTKFLASKGFAVVNFNYRKSPEFNYPDAFLDVCYLMNHIQKKACQYQFDLDRLYMVGDSAGAQLACQYGIYANSKEYQKLYSEVSHLSVPGIKRLALNCGFYKVDIKEEITKWYLPKEISRNHEKGLFEMLEYINEHFPETYLMTSVNDPLLPKTKPLMKMLENNKIPYMYREFGKSNEQDSHVFHLNLKSKEGQKCNQEEVTFFRRGVFKI